MSGTCTPPVVGASLATIITAAIFIIYIRKLKKAIKAKKPVPFPNMATQVFVYIFLAGALLNVLTAIFVGFKPN
jgi:hypothetical protein